MTTRGRSLRLALVLVGIGAACAGTQESTHSSTNGEANDVAQSEVIEPEGEDQNAAPPETRQGAIVTADCLFGDYPYAIDILLSCGSEETGAPLRLHTFKRHAHDHRLVFNDQRITYREGLLWFDTYRPALCLAVSDDAQLRLVSEENDCTSFTLRERDDVFMIQAVDSQLCAGLGETSCDQHRSTGGSECGGIDHRYLPLVFGDCNQALGFTFKQEASVCEDEYPGASCFTP